MKNNPSFHYQLIFGTYIQCNETEQVEISNTFDILSDVEDDFEIEVETVHSLISSVNANQSAYKPETITMHELFGADRVVTDDEHSVVSAISDNSEEDANFLFDFAPEVNISMTNSDVEKLDAKWNEKMKL